MDHYFSNVHVFHTLGQLMIVVEFAEHGNLHRYLRDQRKQNYDDTRKYSLEISSAERLRIACDVAEGMKHLAFMRVRYKFFHNLYAWIIYFVTFLSQKFVNRGLSFFSLKHTLTKVLQCPGVNSVLTTHLPRQLYLRT